MLVRNLPPATVTFDDQSQVTLSRKFASHFARAVLRAAHDLTRAISKK